MQRRGFLSSTALLFGSALLFNDQASATEREQSEPEESMKDHVCLITGGTSGMGETAARYLAKRGARIAFCGRRENLGQKIEREIIQNGGKCKYFKCDVRSEKQVEQLIKETIKQYGQMDSIFVNAGIANIPQPLHMTSPESAREMMETNYFGSLYSSMYALRHFIERKTGVIIFNTSFGVEQVIPGEAPYSASKSAIGALVNHIAVSYAKFNIKSYSIEPLCVRSPMIENHAKTIKKHIRDMKSPIVNRIIEPEEVAELIKFLVQYKSPILSGSHLDLSSGKKFMYSLPKV